MNKKCTVKNEKKIKKVRNNGWEKLKFIEQNSKNKKKIFLDKPSDTMHNSKRPRILLKTFFLFLRNAFSVL